MGARTVELSQDLIAENIVTLFEIDLTKYGIGTGRFTTDVDESGQPLQWGGQPYLPMVIEASGFERQSSGSAVRPKLRIANTNVLLNSLIIEGKDLVGCEVRRYRTFRRFLDDGIEPNREEHFPAEIYRVERKVSQNRITVEFELANVLDQEGIKLPKRLVLRDYCSFIYRIWSYDTNNWVFDPFDPCPYAGNRYFDKDGNEHYNPYRDVCGKRIFDCHLRFGENAVLPARCFPGVGRVK